MAAVEGRNTIAGSNVMASLDGRSQEELEEEHEGIFHHKLLDCVYCVVNHH